MRRKIWSVIKILFIIILVLWMILFITDYFRARSKTKPFVCLSENTITIAENETYYRCISFGYKYYEYNNNGNVTYGFGASFLKNDIEKEIGE